MQKRQFKYTKNANEPPTSKNTPEAIVTLLNVRAERPAQYNK